MKFSAVNLILLIAAAAASAAGQQATLATEAPQHPGWAYYVDCSAPVNGNGSKSHPWNTLSGPNAYTFRPGDKLLLKRGTTCQGTLFPQGSGSDDDPIIIDAYGVGAQPIIDGEYNEEAILLSDQQYWEIHNLEIVGGYQYGIFIWGDKAYSSLNHFHLINLNLHDAHYVTSTFDDSGEVQIQTNGVHQLINDVLIDGVITHDSHVAAGIWVDASGAYGPATEACIQNADRLLGNHITIQNSSAYNLDGAGIWLLNGRNGLIQRNVVHNIGLVAGYDDTGITEHCCHRCMIQHNESYGNHTPNLYDGGGFDIDLFNIDNVLQYNYAHDCDGYCVGEYSAFVAPNRNSVIRYNICSNNNRKAATAVLGDFWFSGAPLEGTQIYTNVSYWNPANNAAAFEAQYTQYTGTNPNFFKNNIIYSTSPAMINANSGITLDNNIYWSIGSSAPTWEIDSVTYTGFSAYQAATGQDAHSFYTDPMLNDPTYHGVGWPTTAFTLQPGSPAIGTGADVCEGIPGCSMGKHDFFGNPLPDGSGYDIGADQAP